ncbi:hypothetical protein EYR36_001554 [Pleurotus pulmonarius]|nr:hypothetical protein EYR36_001554 [Pleurotus pulmonarius]
MSSLVEATPPRKKANPLLLHVQATPISRKYSGLIEGQKLDPDDYKQKRAGMCQEMSGYWVGPCEANKFFELTMPLDLEEGAVEELPNIDPKFFAGKKPANEDEVYTELGTFFMKTPEKSHFEGLKMVDSSRHADPDSKAGSKVKPDGALHDADDASVTVATPTRLGSALSPLELKDWLLELFDDLATKQGRGYDPTVKLASDEETKLAQERLKEWEPKHHRPVFKMDVYDDVEEEMEDNDQAEVCTSDTNVGAETTQAADENVKKTPTPRKFLVWGSLADPDSPLGRATRGYPALEVTDGLEKAKDAPLVFLKEQWRSKAIERGEIAILRELNKHGVEHVPTFVCGGDLPGQVTQTDVFANEIGRMGGKHIDQRTHVRFVVEEVGRPLESFSSSKEMFRAIYDAFQGHKQAFEKCEILHRDISGGNILILPKGGGLLNDWDMAVKVEEAKLGPRAHERTGTWAFMSIDLLSGTKCLHKVSDDMESFFWVVLYYSLLYLPHNKAGELSEIIPAVFEQYTYSTQAKGGDGKIAVVASGKYIGAKGNPRLEFTLSKPLTEFVKAMLSCMRVWGSSEMNASDAADQSTIFSSTAPPIPEIPERTHKDVIHIWDGTLALPWPTGDKAILQFVKKSEGGTEGGGSKKRKSTTQLEPTGGTEGRKPKKSKTRTNAKIPSTGTRKSSRLRRG